MFYPQELEVGEEVKKGDQITSVIGNQLVDKIITQTIFTTYKKYPRNRLLFGCLVSFRNSNGITKELKV
jgi:hypothetical protein